MKYAQTIMILLLALLFCLPSALGDEITVPEFTNIKSFSFPDSPALSFVRNLGCGWNLGNTFDAFDDSMIGNKQNLEKYWCGVKTTQEMITTVYKAGFRSIRLPVSWHNHVDTDFNIDAKWMNRVQEVVDWCMNEGFYVILNTHHDVGIKYYYPDTAHAESSERYLSCIWKQIAERFRDYDEHLILESFNEPRLKDTDVEWWLNPIDPRCIDSAKEISRLNQVFVNVVRAAGGKNAERYLMLPGYDASPEGALSAYYVLPEDSIENHLIVSVHAYTPYEFALNLQGTDSFSASRRADQNAVTSFMDKLYRHFIAKGIPVVIGEYGALDKNNLQSRVDFFSWYVANASARSIPCLVWDNNAFSGSGERFGFLKRQTLTWPFPDIVQAIQTYALQP
ncbi:MAG: glycoside hydrolase family 5 protein [Clostridiales bacterium]|nr:glycoside hydrolase family 5 protein [Clostridiales bacterium]